MGGDGARDKDWLREGGASPVSYRHNFLVLTKFGNFALMSLNFAM